MERVRVTILVDGGNVQDVDCGFFADTPGDDDERHPRLALLQQFQRALCAERRQMEVGKNHVEIGTESCNESRLVLSTLPHEVTPRLPLLVDQQFCVGIVVLDDEDMQGQA